MAPKSTPADRSKLFWANKILKARLSQHKYSCVVVSCRAGDVVGEVKSIPGQFVSNIFLKAGKFYGLVLVRDTARPSDYQAAYVLSINSNFHKVPAYIAREIFSCVPGLHPENNSRLGIYNVHNNLGPALDIYCLLATIVAVIGVELLPSHFAYRRDTSPPPIFFFFFFGWDSQCQIWLRMYKWFAHTALCIIWPFELQEYCCFQAMGHEDSDTVLLFLT